MKQFDLLETSKLKGHWKLDVYKGDIQTPENFLESMEGDNLITTSGKGLILDRLFGLSSIPAMARMIPGTNATAANIADTAITGGVYTSFDTVPTRNGLVVTCASTFDTTLANFNWQELGMASGNGVLLNRLAPIGPFNKTSAVSIVVTVTITQS